MPSCETQCSIADWAWAEAVWWAVRPMLRTASALLQSAMLHSIPAHLRPPGIPFSMTVFSWSSPGGYVGHGKASASGMSPPLFVSSQRAWRPKRKRAWPKSVQPAARARVCISR